MIPSNVFHGIIHGPLNILMCLEIPNLWNVGETTLRCAARQDEIATCDAAQDPEGESRKLRESQTCLGRFLEVLFPRKVSYMRNHKHLQHDLSEMFHVLMARLIASTS